MHVCLCVIARARSFQSATQFNFLRTFNASLCIARGRTAMLTGTIVWLRIVMVFWSKVRIARAKLNCVRLCPEVIPTSAVVHSALAPQRDDDGDDDAIGR